MSYDDWYNSLSKKEKLRKNLFVYGDRFTDWYSDKTDSAKFYFDFVYSLEHKAQELFCLLLSHAPVADQCGIPEHDYCAYCLKSTPKQAQRGK